MNRKHWFGFNIFVLMISSIMLFIYSIAVLISPFIILPGYPKEILYIGLAIGYVVAFFLTYLSIDRLYRMIEVKVTKDVPPLDKTEFGKLCDDIKGTNIGQDLMNHVMECEDCKQKSLELNQQASKHIEETGKLV